jgi:hypothetical protein
VNVRPIASIRFRKKSTIAAIRSASSRTIPAIVSAANAAWTVVTHACSRHLTNVSGLGAAYTMEFTIVFLDRGKANPQKFRPNNFLSEV